MRSCAEIWPGFTCFNLHISSIVCFVVHPSSSLASEGSAHMAVISPSLRASYFSGIFVLVTRSNTSTSSLTDTPLPVPRLYACGNEWDVNSVKKTRCLWPEVHCTPAHKFASIVVYRCNSWLKAKGTYLTVGDVFTALAKVKVKLQWIYYAR